MTRTILSLIAVAGLSGCALFHGGPGSSVATPDDEPPVAPPEPTPDELPGPTEGQAIGGAVIGVEAPPVEPRYRLLVPLGGQHSSGFPPVEDMAPDDPRRAELESLLGQDYLRFVLDAGASAAAIALRACVAQEDEAICVARHDNPALFVIVEGGNRPKQGLAIVGAERDRVLPEAWYVEVDPRRAATLVPHEYGHAIMFGLLGAEPPDHPPLLPHTTGAISDDVLAFSEGWGIHFETLAGDRPELVPVRSRLARDVFPVAGPLAQGDSLLEGKDLLSYSQSYRRYLAIKENRFATLPRIDAGLAARGTPMDEELLARWTDTTADPARLRTLEQMVASEGLVATLFYRLATAGSPAATADASGARPLPSIARYEAFFEAFAAMTWEADAPSLLEFLARLVEGAETDERRRMVRTALEVFHYVGFIDDAATFHAELHGAGHRMDLPHFREALGPASEARAAAVERLVETPDGLLTAAGPELWLSVPDVALGFAIFGMDPVPLVIDLNSAPEEFLMALPGVDHAIAAAIAARRLHAGPFARLDDLAAVDGVDAAIVDALRALRWPPPEADEIPAD
jgi:hypothetical protein